MGKKIKAKKYSCVICGCRVYPHNVSSIRVDACLRCYPVYDDDKEAVIKKYINNNKEKKV